MGADILIIHAVRLAQVHRRAEEVRTPGEAFPDVERIAVVRNDRLGDLVLTLPAIAALRATYPRARLALVVRPATAPLARMVVGVDSVIEDPGTLPGLTKALRESNPDLLVSIAIGARSALAGAAAEVRYRVGPGYRAYSPLFHRVVNEHRSKGGRHEVEYALSYAHRSGAPGAQAKFPLEVPLHKEGTVDGWLRAKRVEKGFVVLHPGSGGSCPRWPVSHFVALARGLLARGRQVVLSVGPSDAEVKRAFAEEAAIRFESSIPSLAALLTRTDFVVSNSTGPLHLAAALGTATLAIHAPWPTCGAGRWGPYAPNGCAIEAGFGGAREWPRAEREKRADEVMASLSPEAVLEVALGLLDRSS